MYFTNLLCNISFTIYAISDIYNIHSYARIKTYIKTHINNNHLTIVSGDFISPSKYTNIDGGEFIMKVFNSVPIDLASFGNHEFDISPTKLNTSLHSNTKTTFISTNIKYISNTHKYYIYYDNLTNITIGFIGLCGNDFYQKYSIEFSSDNDINNTIQFIEENYNPDYLIALTHFDLENDYLYVKKFPQIDIVLGGHIHSYDYTEYNNIPIIRTGENAESIFQIDFYPDKSYDINMYDISKVIPDKSIETLFLENEKKFNEYNKIVLFNFKSEYSIINPRNQKESLCVLFCSLITKYFNSFATILNAGFFRKTGIFTGKLTFGDLQTIFPFEDDIIVIRMELMDLIDGIKYSNHNYKNKGGFIQSDIFDFDIKSFPTNAKINVSTTKMMLRGIDYNPYFMKYSNSFGELDGIRIHNIIVQYKDMIFL